MTPRVITGLEVLTEAPPSWMRTGRLGLLCHPASVDGGLRHAREVIHALAGGRLQALFSPQHGFLGEKQDNMIESGHMRDALLGLPVYSLYGDTRVPTAAMLADIDVLLVDLQDVGTRVYTYIWTLSHCMEAARDADTAVVVLDRPNPLGGERVEGNCLKPAWASFVGRFGLPMRHGLTIGELARLFNTAYGIGCDLTVVPMRGWRREMRFEDTGLPWVPPSPNLPTPESAAVYPGQVVWEGTNVSEGRGTTRPFELFGAPFLDPRALLETLGGPHVPGAVLRPAAFEPTWNKWCNEVCHGFQVHLTDRCAFRPYETSLRLLQAVLSCHGDAFAWKPPPYEYEFERQPIDLILGDGQLRERLAALTPLATLQAAWQPGLQAFTRRARREHLYT